MTARITRRHFLKIVAGTGLETGLGPGLIHRRRSAFTAGQVTATRAMIGTIVNLTVTATDTGTAQNAVGSTFAEMVQLVAIFDRRQPRSPLARLNRHSFLPSAPPELVDVLTLSRNDGTRTAAAFDVTVKPSSTPAAAAGLHLRPSTTSSTIALCNRSATPPPWLSRPWPSPWTA